MSLAVLTAVYPKAEPYIADMVKSLAEQTDQDYVLYVLNDGVSQVEKYFSALINKTKILPVSGTASYIRKHGIRQMIADGIGLVVFADSDDFFSPNRIALSRHFLKTFDVVVNELMTFGENCRQPTALLGPHIKNGERLTLSDVLDHNMLGLSNTAARVACISKYFEHVGDDLIAFDWALYVRALFDGASCVFTSQAITHYRQHHDNIATIDQLDDTKLLQAVRVKAAHFAALADIGKPFRDRSCDYGALLDHFEKRPENVRLYSAFLKNHKPPSGLWWSSAQYPKEFMHASVR
jgi:glycosyltransferase involved in cell wall biosynthesis